VFKGKNSRVLLLFTLFCTAALLFVTHDGDNADAYKEERIRVFKRAVSKTIISPVPDDINMTINVLNVGLQNYEAKRQEDENKAASKDDESSKVSIDSADIDSEGEADEFVPDSDETELLENLLHSEIKHSTYRTELLLKLIDNELQRVELEVQNLIPPEYAAPANEPRLQRIVVERSENGKVVFGEETKVTSLNYPAKVYITTDGRVSRAIGEASIVLHAKEGASNVRGVVVIRIGGAKETDAKGNTLDFAVDESGRPQLVFSQEFELSSVEAPKDADSEETSASKDSAEPS
jgi:hypothetical protein